MSWNPVIIGDHVKKISTWNPRQSLDSNEFKYIDLSSIDKDKKSILINKITSINPAEAPSRAKQLVTNNDVLVATVRPNLNGVAVVPQELNNATASTGYCVLRTDGKSLDYRYLYYWLQTKNFINDMINKSNGANYPAVSDKIIKESIIPLPPLSEQKRLSVILDKAGATRSKRQQSIQLVDEFLKSVFMDMFGDPVTNSKGWEIKPLEEIAAITTGNTPSRKKTSYFGDFIEWIKSDNINTPDYTLTKSVEFLSEEGYKVGRSVPAGSVLVTCIAGSFDCIGNVAFADREVAFNQQINALTPFDGVGSWFLFALIYMSKDAIQAASTNAMKGMVSKGKMQKISLILPPYKLQMEFEKRFKIQRKMLKKLYVSLEDSNNMFNSLSQKAFSGEL